MFAIPLKIPPAAAPDTDMDPRNSRFIRLKDPVTNFPNPFPTALKGAVMIRPINRNARPNVASAAFFARSLIANPISERGPRIRFSRTAFPFANVFSNWNLIGVIILSANLAKRPVGVPSSL